MVPAASWFESFEVPTGRHDVSQYPNTTFAHVVPSGLGQWLLTIPWACAHG